MFEDISILALEAFCKQFVPSESKLFETDGILKDFYKKNKQANLTTN